ncbi:LamG-like jellyroll fold domain-containing protein [Flavobacterium sp. NRK F7]|uniref:LamG-like jellyroll fold domain-containing protein n=1 Tax=Flavobacterium sp. NRK F7 TaxID=2954930 RepID=UPI0020910730|nr:LamG-like jellyroll fold domain-containing protein [Flavobacterium sp. NRK F7]MCO6161261.1 T9SS type A sorting domain-containing protein [Flavobacterium sp. NRK F7]
MRTKLFSFLIVLFYSALNAQVPTSGLIYNFKFDNSPTSEAGTETFTSNSTISYTSNRFGNTNKAIAKSYGQLIYTNLTNLPTVNESRSISIWIKPTVVNSDNIIFTYGTGSGSQIYGASFNSTTIYNFTYSSNVAASSSVVEDNWKHLVITYNNSNTVAKIYVNGVLINQGNIGLNTFNTQFYLGSLLNSPTASHFIGAMDDLLIYNRELSASEVSQIYIDGIPPSNSTIAEYSFDNTYNNINGNSPFSNNSGTSFVMDRHGNSNGALNINNTGTSATIINLPYSNTARTISFWAKVNSMQSPYNMTFSYGQSSNSNACGGSFRSDRVEFFGFNNNFAGLSANTTGVWYHFTYTYDGNEAKIYKNGVVLNAFNLNLNTLNNNDIFKLGVGVGGELNFNGAIDDLKIYNYVLSDTQITNLYTNNTLSANDFNHDEVAIKMYPNPVQDILNVDLQTNLKSVEVYTIQGQKILESDQNQINVSSLVSAIYMVRIQDENNAVITKKIIKK